MKNGKKEEYEIERERSTKIAQNLQKEKKMLPFNPQEVGILQQLEYTSFC